MDASTWAAIISAGAAIIAALYTYQSARVARKSLELMQQQEQRRSPKLTISLVDAHIRKVARKQIRMYVFHLSIANQSEAENAIKEMSLTVTYNHGHRPNSTVVASHDDSLADHLPSIAAEPFHIPKAIGAHQAGVGLALFRVDNDILSCAIIEAYEIQVVDGHGVASSLEPIILHEVSDEA